MLNLLHTFTNTAVCLQPWQFCSRKQNIGSVLFFYRGIKIQNYFAMPRVTMNRDTSKILTLKSLETWNQMNLLAELVRNGKTRVAKISGCRRIAVL